MKKILAISTATALSLGGVAVSVPAFAVGENNPTFGVSSFNAEVGTAFNEVLTPTFSGSESWYYGSRAYLDTESCDALPAGLSYPQDGVANPNGTSPTYQITGTPEAGTEGVYNICFYTEDNPEGWVPLGNSQVVTITVTAAPAEATATSAGALSGTANAAFNEIVGYTSTGFAWSGMGTVSAVNLPAGIDLAVSGYDVDGSPILLASGAPTTAGSFTADITLTDGAQTATFSQIFNVSEASAASVAASASAISAGESVTISVANAPTEDSWVAWFINGEYVDGGYVLNIFPQTVSYGDFTFVDPSVTNTVTWSLYSSAQMMPLITDPSLASVNVDWTAQAAAPTAVADGFFEGTVGETVTDIPVYYTWTGFNFTEGATLEATGLPNGLTATINGYSEIDGSPIIVVNGAATAAGNYTTQFTITANGQSASFDYSFDVIEASEPINPDNGSASGTTDFFNTDAFWEMAENGAGYISDAGTTNTNDAYDDFGYVKGINWDGSSFALNATTEPVIDENSISYISENVWSHDAQEYVDVKVTRTFIGNTVTWNVEVFKTGTDLASTLTMVIDGNLGSDSSTTWVTSNGYVTSNDQFDGDPVIVWNTNGTMTNSDGNDDVVINFANAGTASLQQILIGYNCADSISIQSYVDGITANYNSNVNTNIADLDNCVAPVTPEVTVDNNGTFVNGTDSSVDFALTTVGDWNWTYGGTITLDGLPAGLSYTVNNEWVDGEIPTFTIYGTANDVAGDYTVTATLSDDYSGSASSTFTVTVEEAAAATMTVSPETFTGVVGNIVDVTLDLTTTGLNFAEGFEGSVEGLPAGMEYEFLTDVDGNVNGLRIFGLAAEVATGSLTITVTDVNSSSASNSDVTWDITAAPIVIEQALALNTPVGGNIDGAGADYEASGLKEGTEWALTLRSTPTVIASGIATADGIIAGTALIPAGLEAGWHSITLTGTDVNGNAVNKVVWFEISANGTILAEQDTAPVTPEPVVPAEPALASTGANIAGALGGGAALLALGGLVMGFARRKEANS